MTNGGEIANRGFIFQTVITLIKCLDPDNDWDYIKTEPKTEEEKVDIMLYKDGKAKSAIQVRSSINLFERSEVKKWLENLKKDAIDAEKVCLCLVGDTFSPSCRIFIEENSSEIETVSFKNLQRESTFQLIEYIKRTGLGGRVRIDDLELLDAGLFSRILRNSISEEPVSREEFEVAFRKAIPQGEELEKQIEAAESGLIINVPVIPQCLTQIPFIDKETGLVGRADFLREIREMLENNTGIALVNGLGGIGKTAVMEGICDEVKDEGHYVAWIRCGNSLQDDLLILRDAFGVPKEEKAEEAYRIVKAGIQQLGRKLYLFMDDLSREVTRDEREEINGLGVHVMITSRADNLPFPKKKLEYLDEDSAVKMFQGYYGGKSGDKETLLKIIRSVKCHTLLVELLAKAAREEGGTLEEFYKKLKYGLLDVLKKSLWYEYDDGSRIIEKTVINLYEMSGLSNEQRRIMKLFTIFSPGKEIYYKVRDWAEFDRKELRKLVGHGWLERGGLENGYQIHQIVRDSIALQMEKKGEKVILEEYGDFLYRVIDTDSYLGREDSYDKIRERIVLTEDVARFLMKCSREDAAAGTLFHNIGGVYYQLGEYGKALEYCRIALSILERVLGPDHPALAGTYYNMAAVYNAQGENEKALEYYEKALLIREHALGQDHPETAATYNNMAKVYREQGEYEKALEYSWKALTIHERVLGKDHPDTAVAYNNMAVVYAAQGENEKALEYYKKALVICERVLPRDHPKTASIYNNIGVVYNAQGKFEEAQKYFEKALEIRKLVLGPDHPATAVMYSNMADLFRAQGEYGKAQEYYKKAYATFLSKMGEDHPTTQRIKRNIMTLDILLLTGMTEDQMLDSLNN